MRNAIHFVLWRRSFGFLLAIFVAIGTLTSATGAQQFDPVTAIETSGKFLAVVVPVWLAGVWGQLADARISSNLMLVGERPRPFLLKTLISTGIGVVICAAVAGSSGVLVMGFARPSDPGIESSSGVVLRAIVVVLCQAIVLTCTMFVLVGERSALFALAVGFIAPILQLFSQLRSFPGAPLVATLWPPSATSKLFDSDIEALSGEGLTASLVVVLPVLAAIVGARLDVGVNRRGGLLERSLVRSHRSNCLRVVSLAALVTLIGGALLPIGLSKSIAGELQPSYLLSSRRGDAPHQIAQSFFSSVWATNFARASRLSYSGDYAEVLVGFPTLRDRSTLINFSTIELSLTGHADVLANLDSGSLHVCMRKKVDRWTVESVSPEGCQRGGGPERG